MKFSKNIKLLLLLTASLLLLFCQICSADGIDPQEPVSFTLHYTDGDFGIGGAQMRLYKVADMDEAMNYQILEPFSGYPIDYRLDDPEQWESIAATLAAYLERDAVAPVDTAVTDSRGDASFPSEGKQMTAGYYLLASPSIEIDDIRYTVSPFLIVLPYTDENSGNLIYHAEILPKYEMEHKETQQESRSLSVVKVWNDSGYELSRPAGIIADLLRDGEVYDSVTLSAENNWRYSWGALDPDASWRVVERDSLGYQVAITEEETGFVITNTYSPVSLTEDIPVNKRISGGNITYLPVFTFRLQADDPSFPMPEGSVNGVKEITISGAGTSYFGRITFSKAGIYTYQVSEVKGEDTAFIYDTRSFTVRYEVTEEGGGLKVVQTMTESRSPSDMILFKNTYSPPDKPLPVTGLTWWPVPVFAGCGMVLILIGLCLCRKRKK